MLAFNTLNDPILRVAAWAGCAAFALTGLLALQTVWLRLKLKRHQAREGAFLQRWRPALALCLMEKDAPLPVLAKSEHVYFLKLWNHLRESIRGEAVQHLIDAAERLGASAVAKQLLAQGNRPERLLAILTLGNLRCMTAWAELESLAKSGDTVESFGALRALIQIDPDHCSASMTHAMLERTDWSLARLAASLLDQGAHFANGLYGALGRPESLRTDRALGLLAALHLPLPETVLSALLSGAPGPERLLGILRTTPTPAMLQLARRHPGHPDWRVRLQVAKLLGVMGAKQDLPDLLFLLRDSEWWVRYRAGQALLQLPFISVSDCLDILHVDGDPFAADMLRQVLAERKPT